MTIGTEPLRKEYMRRIKKLEEMKMDKKPTNEVTRHFIDILKNRGSLSERINKNRLDYGHKD